MLPTPRGKAQVYSLERHPATGLCKFDRAYDAYRRALELAEHLGYKDHKHGYPIWWRNKEQVLAYLPRGDGHLHIDQDDPNFEMPKESMTIYTLHSPDGPTWRGRHK